MTQEFLDKGRILETLNSYAGRRRPVKALVVLRDAIEGGVYDALKSDPSGAVPPEIMGRIREVIGDRPFFVSEWSGTQRRWEATVYVRGDVNEDPIEYHLIGGKPQ